MPENCVCHKSPVAQSFLPRNVKGSAFLQQSLLSRITDLPVYSPLTQLFDQSHYYYYLDANSPLIACPERASCPELVEGERRVEGLTAFQVLSPCRFFNNILSYTNHEKPPQLPKTPAPMAPAGDNSTRYIHRINIIRITYITCSFLPFR